MQSSVAPIAPRARFIQGTAVAAPVGALRDFLRRNRVDSIVETATSISMSVLPGRKGRALQSHFQVNEEPALQGDINQNACSVAKTNLGRIDTRSELERRLPEVFRAVHLKTRGSQLLSRCGLALYQTRSSRGHALGALLQKDIRSVEDPAWMSSRSAAVTQCGGIS